MAPDQVGEATLKCLNPEPAQLAAFQTIVSYVVVVAVAASTAAVVSGAFAVLRSLWHRRKVLCNCCPRQVASDDLPQHFQLPAMLQYLTIYLIQHYTDIILNN